MPDVLLVLRAQFHNCDEEVANTLHIRTSAGCILAATWRTLASVSFLIISYCCSSTCMYGCNSAAAIHHNEYIRASKSNDRPCSAYIYARTYPHGGPSTQLRRRGQQREVRSTSSLGHTSPAQATADPQTRESVSKPLYCHQQARPRSRGICQVRRGQHMHVQAGLCLRAEASRFHNTHTFSWSREQRLKRSN